jgi:hypothetical protein
MEMPLAVEMVVLIIAIIVATAMILILGTMIVIVEIPGKIVALMGKGKGRERDLSDLSNRLLNDTSIGLNTWKHSD